MQVRYRSSAMIAVLVLFLIGSAAFSAEKASADGLTVVSSGTIPVGVYVQNPSGMALPDVNIYDGSGTLIGTSNSSGLATYEAPYQCFSTGACVYSYAALRGSRSDGSGDPCQRVPEGWPGASAHWIPTSARQMAVITLPQLPGAAFQPALSDEELGMVGLINQAREADGLVPVTVSSVLTASADKYLGSIPARQLDYGQDAIYCENADPGIRAADAGFPTTDNISESVLQGDANAAAAFTDLQGDPHQDVLVDPQATLVGIAQEGGTWVIDASQLQTNDPTYARAGDTGNTGDASLVAGEFPPPTPVAPTAPTGDGSTGGTDSTYPQQPATSPPVAREPQLHLAHVSTKGRRVRATLALSPKARGAVRAYAFARHGKKGKKVALHAKRHGKRVWVWGHLGRGRWLIRLHFAPRSGSNWKPRTVTHRLRVRR